MGGKWDRLNQKFSDDEEPQNCAIISCKESQVGVVLQAKAWLEKFISGDPNRERLLLTGGNRRGGKSYITTACLLAIAIAVPESICWLVSPNLTKRDELERYVKDQAKPEWLSYRGIPVYRFTLPNGSTIQSITGDTADALKRGEATAILYNEPQDMMIDVVTYGLPALIDEGGLAMFAGNPARRQRGEWFNNLREAIIEGQYKPASFFSIPSASNDSIDQSARADIGSLLTLIDPRAAKADDEGLWLPVGDRAYPKFDKTKHLQVTPQVGDITGEVLRKKGERQYQFVAGVDFQGTPHHAGVVVKVFNGHSGASIYWATDELLTEGVEEEFLADIDDKGLYEPGNLLWIGDASGQWQDGKHSAGRGRMSFDIFKKFRWHIKPPVLKKSDKGEFSKNPHIDDRLNLVNKLLDAKRLVIDPERCPRLAEAIKDCPLKSVNGRRKPYGRLSHITDALGYALFWLEPRPKPTAAAPSLDGIMMAKFAPRGPRIL